MLKLQNSGKKYFFIFHMSPYVPIQQLPLKGLTRVIAYLNSTLYKLYSDTVFIALAILAFFTVIPYPSYHLAHPDPFSFCSNNSLKYDYLT